MDKRCQAHIFIFGATLSIFVLFAYWPIRPNFEVKLNFLFEFWKGVDRDCACWNKHSRKYEDFCYRASQHLKGKRFNCSSLPYLQGLQLLPTKREKTKKLISIKPVFVTALSSNHFHEGLKFIGSTQNKFPGEPIFVYDLGLHEDEINQIKGYCDVQYRKFNAQKYSSRINGNALHEYRWKLLIIAEALAEFPAIWWCDTSVRWFDVENISGIYKSIISGSKSPYMLADQTGHSIFSTTHKGMYDFLPGDMALLKRTQEIGASLSLSIRDKTTQEILKWLVLCALEPNCMAPPGANIICNFKPNDRWITFANCHRFDQAAINIILATRNQYNYTRYIPDLQGFFKINRRADDAPDPKKC